MRSTLSLAALALAACTTSQGPELALRQVVLYQNGIGYFERAGRLEGDRLRLTFRSHELDDALKTLTIVDRSAKVGALAMRVAQPRPGKPRDGEEVEVVMRAGGAEEVTVAYAVPTPAWKATYRLVLGAGGRKGRLQAWAMVDNVSGEDWTNVQVALDTGSPLSLARDLRTPQFVARPDVTGKLVTPVALAPVASEKPLPGDADGDGVPDGKDRCPSDAEDRDGFQDEDGCADPDNDRDGIPDVDDLCPADPEDRDGFEDQDGCADPDNDKDRILDRTDRCPNDPETYNGFDDEDGCPDRGRVIVSHASIEILDKVYFRPGSDDPGLPSRPILDALVATLKGNPQIRTVAVNGHAADDEPDAWGVSARRAGAVRAYLLGKGVTTTLRVLAFGPTQPTDPRRTAPARAKNRRVEFQILDRDDGEPPPRASRSVPTTPAAVPSPQASAGLVRYQVGAPITVARGASILLSIADCSVEAEEALLFRPDPGAPGSQQHPFRVARLRNGSGLTLVPGPVVMYSGGAFVGEGMLERLHAGESAFVPYSLEGRVAVRAESVSTEQPSRLLSVVDGVATLEDQELAITRYQIASGSEAPIRLFLRHARRSGYTVQELPPGSETTADAYLIPIPLAGARASTLEVREARPARRSLRLLDSSEASRLELYLAGGGLPEALVQKLRAALALGARAAELARRLEELRARLGDQGAESGEVRQSLLAINKVGGDPALKRRLVERLRAATAASEKLARELAAADAAHAEAVSRLREAVRGLKLEERR